MFTAFLEVVHALYFIFPAYCANATPMIFGGGYPIDGGRRFLDGRFIFGQNKTIRGFCAGLFSGIIVSIILKVLFQYNLMLGLMLSLGALVGDLIESFIKRRVNIAPGSPFPIADQLDFVLGSLLFSSLVSPPPLSVILILIVITPPIHALTNFIAYTLGIKSRPW